MFDDGQVEIYQLTDIAEKGDLPKWRMDYLSAFWYEERTIGVTRFYAALKTEVKLDLLIRIWRDKSINTAHICKIDDAQYRIAQIQHVLNEDGLEVSDLSLERLGELYDIR